MLLFREPERRCRMAFADLYKPQWGSYRFEGERKLRFESNTVFTLYSAFNAKQAQWWYSVPEREWEDWGSQSLVFLMRELSSAYYVLLNPQEAENLLSRCNPKTQYKYKYISIRKSKRHGSIYCVEWKEFPISTRLCSLEVSWV
jgi:hypothetical protein